MRSRSERRARRVIFVELPFGPVAWPAIGPSLLTARLENAGHDAKVLYANMDLLGEAGPPSLDSVAAYHSVADAYDVHAGEWVFAAAAFPDADLTASDDRYLARLRNTSSLYRELVPRLLALREQARVFIQRTVSRVLGHEPDVIGLGTSFSQTNAAFAFARELRRHSYDRPIMVGGCAAADEMGVAALHACKAIDAVALAEADEIIVDLVEALHERDGERLTALSGVAVRLEERVLTGAPKVRVSDVNALPLPCYDDYFEALPEALGDLLPHYLPVEASRGCWWGAKSHCTFCGLNPARMAFHAKSATRFLGEIEALRDRHRPRRFMAVDNIMPHGYHRSVIPALRAASGGAEFFFEVKANFRRAQMQGLAAAGVLQIQPGIESLSTPVLQLMRKGTTAIANVYALRLVQECGLRAHWSILYGFAGETLEDYLASAQLAARIFHLSPPMGAFPVEVERFAPMFRFPERHGLTGLRPSSWYRHCFPVEDALLGDLAYRFDADYLDRPDSLSDEIRSLMEAVVGEWRRRHAQGRWTLEVLEHDAVRTRLTVHRRAGDSEVSYRLDRRGSRLLQSFARPRNVATVVRNLSPRSVSEPYRDARFLGDCPTAAASGRHDIELRAGSDVEAYHELLRHGLVVEESGRAVSPVCGLNVEEAGGDAVDPDPATAVGVRAPDRESALTFMRLAST